MGQLLPGLLRLRIVSALPFIPKERICEYVIEGRISVAKRRGWLGRCRAHGMGGFTAWIGWGVLASNLTTLARHQAQVGTR